MTFTIHKEPYVPRLITMGKAAKVLAPKEVNKEIQRTKKMAEEKKLGEETGVKKIHQERADKQGPIGTGADKTPDTDVGGEDVKIGNKEGDKDNG